MLEWNMFLKPVLYVLALITGSVVTFGTSDKLLLILNARLRCALRDSLPTCFSIILLGVNSLMLQLYVLWRRLVAAFDDSVDFSNVTEATLCAISTAIWMLVFGVAAFSARPAFRPLTSLDIIHTVDESMPYAPFGTLRGEKIVTVLFAGLTVFLSVGTTAVAWFAPASDYDDSLSMLPQPSLNSLDTLPSSRILPRHRRRSSAPDMDTVITHERSRKATMKKKSLRRRKSSRTASARNANVSLINQRLSVWERELAGVPSLDPVLEDSSESAWSAPLGSPSLGSDSDTFKST